MLDRIHIGEGTRIGHLAWFSLVGDTPEIDIGEGCTLGCSMTITVAGKVTIADGAAVGDRATLSDHGHDHIATLAPAIESGVTPEFSWEVTEPRPITIESGVHVGVGVYIGPGVTIGEGAVVGANSVVTKSVDPFTVVGGIPARPIKSFRSDQ